jgi:outer membrane receptor protein involved in Fe transport
MGRALRPLLFLLFATAVHAQSTISVRVTDQNGLPVPNAMLVLKQGPFQRMGTSDAGGSYRFLGLEPGEYELVAVADGYFPAEKEFLVKPRQPVVLLVELIPRSVAHEEIEVRAADVHLGETSASRLLTHQELASLPATARRDIPSLALFAFPGATLSHDNFVHVRGHEVSLQESVNGVTFLDNPQEQFSPGLTPESFETITLISGSFPAEYGSRFGGIAEATTRSGFDLDGHGSASLSLGSFQTHSSFAEYGDTRGKWGFYVSASGFTTDWYLNPPEPEAFHDFGFGLRGSGQVDYRSSNDSLSLFVAGGGTNFNLPNLEEDEEEGRDAARRLRSHTVILHWQHTFSPATLWTSAVYERKLNDRLVPTTDPVTPLGDGRRSSQTVGGKSDLLHVWRNHIFKTGFDLTRLRLGEQFAFDAREEPLPPEDPEPFTFAQREAGGQASFYVQDHLSITPQWTADIGLRWDYFQLLHSFNQVSPRLAVAYHIPRSQSTLRFAYNRYFSPYPIEYALLANFFGTSAPEPDDRAGPLQPYRQHYLEGGWIQEVHPRLILEVNGFYHRGTRPFEYREISITRLFLPINSTRAVSYGTEITVNLRELKHLGLSGRLQYAYQRTFFFGPLAGGFALGEEIEPGEKFLPAFDEPHSGTAVLLFHRRWHDFSAHWTIRYGSGTAAKDGEERLPGHTTADFGVGLSVLEREHTSVRLEFALANITDYRYSIAKESEETPIQFASPRMVSGRIKVSF